MTAVSAEASRQAVVEAALVLLERMGLTAADLAAAPPPCKQVPTFAEYVPVVSAAVSAGTRRAYGSYWNRLIEHWGARRLDEPTPSEIRQLMAYVKTHMVARRNARGGRSAEEHLVAALRCLYQRAVDDGLIAQADNPACKSGPCDRLQAGRGRPAGITAGVAPRRTHRFQPGPERPGAHDQRRARRKRVSDRGVTRVCPASRGQHLARLQRCT
jgi:hypothetical protein